MINDGERHLHLSYLAEIRYIQDGAEWLYRPSGLRIGRQKTSKIENDVQGSADSLSLVFKSIHILARHIVSRHT